MSTKIASGKTASKPHKVSGRRIIRDVDKGFVEVRPCYSTKVGRFIGPFVWLTVSDGVLASKGTARFRAEMVEKLYRMLTDALRSDDGR